LPEQRSERTRVLLYWHAVGLPHSRYVLEGFDEEPSGAAILAIGPRDLGSASSVFKIGTDRGAPLSNTKLVPVRTYRVRDTWCRFSEWLRHIRSFAPHIIIVMDEAASVNTLLAAIANRLFGNAVVLFYGFENIEQHAGWPAFFRNPTPGGLWQCLRRTARFIALDWTMMPLRRRLIHGGLVSYDECEQIVRSLRFCPPMRQQWWAVNDKTFVSHGSKAEFALGDRYVVGFVGRFTPEKGITDLVRAVAALDDSYALVLIGDGPLTAALQGLAQELGIEHRFRVLAAQDQTRLAASYRAMHLVVLPSHGTQTWKEQYGRVLMEAMRCGVAVAGSNSGAIPDVIQDPAAIFPEGDVPALVNVIKNMRARPPHREQLAQRCAGTGAVEFASAWIQFGRDRMTSEGRCRQAYDAGSRKTLA